MNSRIDEFNKIATSDEIYFPNDEEMIKYQNTLVTKLRKYNLTKDTPLGVKKRNKMLKKMVGTYGEGLVILPPVYANFGLKHVHFGKYVYVNFNSTFVDDSNIYIGDYTLFGPNVTIATPNHPASPKIRKKGYQYNLEVRIGSNVWIGSGAIILPGVTIGDNSIIGAGSVVTKDIPSNVIAFGNPAKVYRKITPEDDKYYNGKEVPVEILKKCNIK